VKNLLVIGITIFLVALVISCGSSSSSSSSATDVSGNWTVAVTNLGSSSFNNTFNLSLVPGDCMAPGDPYPTSQGGQAILFVSGPSGCYIADDMGQDSISGTGYFFYPPQAALVGVRSPPGSPSELQVMFIEAGPNNQYAVFDGSGTITNDEMTGTWSCSPDFTICAGTNGTFSGSKQ